MDDVFVRMARQVPQNIDLFEVPYPGNDIKLGHFIAHVLIDWDSPIFHTFKYSAGFLDSIYSLGLSVLDFNHLTEGAFTHDFKYNKLALENVFALMQVFTRS